MKAALRKRTGPFGILSGCLVFTGVLGGAAWEMGKVREASRCTSLWSAAGEGQNDEVEVLLKAGLDPNCENGRALKSARARGHADTVKLLHRYGAHD